MSEKIIYAGTAVFGVNFNLYSFENYNFEESKEAIEKEFARQFETGIKEALSKAGLQYSNLSYFSPREYNFQGDSLDLVLKVKDLKKLRHFITLNANSIQESMESR